MVQALLIGLIVFFGKMDDFFGLCLIYEPIVLGPLVGLVMGNPTQGIIIGAALELFFIGATSIGASIPPDVIIGGVLATAFAISTGKGTEAAIALALPIAMLALIIKNFNYSVIRPMFAKLADKFAQDGDIRKVQFIHLFLGFLNAVFFGFIAFLSFWLGSSAMQAFLNMIPEVVTNGLTIAAGILPGIGFALLAKTMMNKNVVPFFFLGFVLSAYLKIPILGIAMIGVIIILAWNSLNPASKEIQKEELADDDF